MTRRQPGEGIAIEGLSEIISKYAYSHKLKLAGSFAIIFNL